MNNKEIPKEITDLLDAGAKAYSDSPATTNAGVVLRFISKFVRPSIAIKLLAHILTKK